LLENHAAIDEFAKEYLLGDLRHIREVMVSKLDGLSEYDVRRPLTSTATNLLRLIKHLSIWEAAYFGEVFGRPFPGDWRRWDDNENRLDDMWVSADVSRAEIVDRYREAWKYSDATIAALNIDAPGHVPWWPRPNVKLFNVMVHILTETSRHAGHADILREQLDRALGNNTANSAKQGKFAEMWETHCQKVEQAAKASEACS
jgi:Protein of unknown function (DUF664)